MSACVYVPQETRRRNNDGVFEPVHDLSPALAFGDIVVLYSAMPGGLDPAPMIKAMREKLRNFNDDDYIVATGDPAAIAAAVMVASYVNRGRVRLLRWDRFTRQYMPMQLDAR